MLFRSMAGGSKGGGNKFQTGQVDQIEIQNDVNQSGMNTQVNVSAANGVVNDSNMAQIQQLLQILDAGADGKLNIRTRYDK